MTGYHPAAHAAQHPDKIACKFMPSGRALTYGELDVRSNQAAHLLRAQGLERGDVIAILMDNHPSYYEIAWAADRAGLYYTGISSRLTPAEIAYILQDSGASALFTSAALADMASAALAEVPSCTGFHVDGPAPGLRDFRAEVAVCPTDRSISSTG
jgi:long-chain acyl-CoA synthetase